MTRGSELDALRRDVRAWLEVNAPRWSRTAMPCLTGLLNGRAAAARWPSRK